MSKEVQIPFMAELEQKLAKDKVVMTSRTRRYGDPGDTFTIGYQDKPYKFKILGVVRLELEVIARDFHHEHGFETPKDYRIAWKQLHPRKGFIGNQLVTTHIFRRLEVEKAIV